MAGKREKPKDIVAKLRQVEVLQGQGMTIAEAGSFYGLTATEAQRWATLGGERSPDAEMPPHHQAWSAPQQGKEFNLGLSR